MKYIHILTLLIFLSCSQPAKEKQAVDSVATQQAERDSMVQPAKDTVTDQAVSLSFQEVIANSKVKSVPQIETTNYDSFIEEGDYNEVDVKALKLEQIYPDFHSEGQNYQAIANYKIPLSSDFHTVVVTIKRGDHEMESVLINYDLEGSMVAHQVVAYDEIAEGMSQIVSRITPEKLIVDRILWDVSKEIEETIYRLLPDGTFDQIWSGSLNEFVEEFALVDAAMVDLGLNWVQVKTNLIATREHPYQIDETMIVIPQIVDEAEQYFELASHVVLINSRTGDISHRFFEGAANSQWVSDAVALEEISIDSALYKISEDKEAYGVRVFYVGMSRANPSEQEMLSLFTKSENGLKKVLNNYPMRQYSGEWDTNCEGQFELSEKTLSTDSTKHLGFYDIIINNQLTVTTNYLDSQGDCEYDEKVTNESLELIFNGNTYEREE